MSASDSIAPGGGCIDDVVARIERMPISWWHVRTRIIIGVATFFDAFDALAIAFVLPVLVPLWKLNGPQIGFLIAAGYLGQLAGALFFGWIAERYGRLTAVVWSILIFAVMSLACAFAWDYQSLIVARTIQGFGLGGEVPVAATYISELARAKGRGRFVLLYELIFPVGLVATGLVGSFVVPRYGWQWMFVIGALPAFVALFLQRLLPESPRWLATHGRQKDAQAALAWIERETEKSTGQPLPAPRPIVHSEGKAGIVVRSVRPALSAAYACRLGDLVCRLFLQLWPRGLAADHLLHGVQAAAAASAAIRPDHASGRILRRLDLRADHRPGRPPAVVCLRLRDERHRAGSAVRARPGFAAACARLRQQRATSSSRCFRSASMSTRRSFIRRAPAPSRSVRRRPGCGLPRSLGRALSVTSSARGSAKYFSCSPRWRSSARW